MAETAAFNSRTESGSSPGPPLGRVRWTICAMLFVATSINYMDRQVIAILKPTLEHSIGMTEVSYGYIVDAFQIAYAIGLLAAGRLIDKLGTRIGYMLVMAVWSLSAMGHALASTVMEFGFARFFLGLGESGNFPAAIKTVAEWFPRSERSLATGIFNSGANVGAILAPAIVPWVTLRWGWHVAFLTTGLFSLFWILWWFRHYRKPDRSRHADRRGVAPHLSGSSCGRAPVHALATIAEVPPDVGFFDREVSNRSDLVFLSVLVAVVLQREVQSEPFASRTATHHRL
ncbi:MAG: MFS transporter [Terriglobales bacterium]